MNRRHFFKLASLAATCVSWMPWRKPAVDTIRDATSITLTAIPARWHPDRVIDITFSVECGHRVEPGTFVCVIHPMRQDTMRFFGKVDRINWDGKICRAHGHLAMKGKGANPDVFVCDGESGEWMAPV